MTLLKHLSFENRRLGQLPAHPPICKPYRRRLAAVTLLSAGATAAGLLLPYFSKLLVGAAAIMAHFSLPVSFAAWQLFRLDSGHSPVTAAYQFPADR